MIERSAGILMPVSSLHSGYGIGTFGQAAYEFVDWLERAGMRIWQVLPLGPTSYGDSPYQSFSAFAGNPYFIDLDLLIKQGLLASDDLKKLKFSDRTVDYEGIYETRYKVLEKAFSRFSGGAAYKRFCTENADWLDSYALYMALKGEFKQKGWIDFTDDALKNRDSATIEKYRKKLSKTISFYKFLQFEFDEQWFALKKYANERGIKIVGDIPIYVALDSAECFFEPELFELDADFNPTRVAGCPPDAFSEDGQLWGNPLYNWAAHEKSDYSWWIKRIRHSMKLYDITRIDHFRGFEGYYAIPAGAPNARRGKWERGPGMKLFRAIRRELGDVDIIAEDLGFLTKRVQRLLDASGFCGMRVLQFAFGDMDSKNKYLPHNYCQNSVVYTATHDNMTMREYYDGESKRVRAYIKKYLGCDDDTVVTAFVKAAFSSVSLLAIVPFADVIGMGPAGRINTPGTLGGNWLYRIKKRDLTNTTARQLKSLAKLYNRYDERKDEIL